MGYVASRKRAGILAGFLIATVPVCSKADTPGSPVVVHRKVGSEACELVQHGSLIFDKEFAWVEIEGEKAPVYSPELGPDDYLSVSSEVSRRTSKDAHKSGLASQVPGSIYCPIRTMWYPAPSVGDFCVTRNDCFRTIFPLRVTETIQSLSGSPYPPTLIALNR
jgi:hypothetical protein